ncbi:hypothetical protein AWC38_SpisGene8162 [Stylophora pistillata]|uniref:Uncharacterized protein n=1 Tax=Stylophora pistillata TaxID=50429 RepID=A0A2B4SEZ9_STYPI|nr:hypothetical protein AWC38_SpisGene8162 [Stylophora pistillata]
MARRYSRRLREEGPEEDGQSYPCFICLVPITVNLMQVTVTTCCGRGIHRRCPDEHRASSNYCGHCRHPFPSRQRLYDDENDGPFAYGEAQENPVAQFGNIPPPLSAEHVNMRQQAIADLRALLEPGALEARNREVFDLPPINFEETLLYESLDMALFLLYDYLPELDSSHLIVISHLDLYECLDAVYTHRHRIHSDVRVQMMYPQNYEGCGHLVDFRVGEIATVSIYERD